MISVECIRFLSVVRCSDQVQPEASQLTLAADRRVGSQIAGTRSRHDSSASTRASILSVLHANGASPLTFLRVGDQHLPAGLLELVMHEPGAVHRLDHRAPTG